jgi:hypothetical protein
MEAGLTVAGRLGIEVSVGEEESGRIVCARQLMRNSGTVHVQEWGFVFYL